MSILTIRNIEPQIKDKLRMAAASHGRSMEEEVRTILREALTRAKPQRGMGSRIHARFAALGGIDLPVSERTDVTNVPRAADFDEGAPK